MWKVTKAQGNKRDRKRKREDDGGKGKGEREGMDNILALLRFCTTSLWRSMVRVSLSIPKLI